MKSLTILSACLLFIVSSFTNHNSWLKEQESEKLEAKIVQLYVQGNKTVIVLNKGKDHGIHSGQKGMIPALDSIQFKITENYSFRSKGVVDTVISESNLIAIFYVN